MLRRFCAWDLESLHEFKLIQVNPSQSSSQLHIRFVRPLFSKSSFLCAFSFFACSFSSFSSLFFLFKCFCTIFFILFSLPTSTKRTIVVSFWVEKCFSVLRYSYGRTLGCNWKHPRVQRHGGALVLGDFLQDKMWRLFSRFLRADLLLTLSFCDLTFACFNDYLYTVKICQARLASCFFDLFLLPVTSC